MMKGMSVRTKITLYFFAVLALVVAMTFLVILTVGSTVLQQVVGDNLTALVEDNLNEVEYVRALSADARRTGARPFPIMTVICWSIMIFSTKSTALPQRFTPATAACCTVQIPSARCRP